MCEIENRHVLELLRDALAPLGRRYEIVHADTADNRGIDVAFIYDEDRFTAEETFHHFVVKRVATRDLVQVNFRSAAGRLPVLIGNRWPSRTGGRWESEPYRILAGETLAYFHQRIREVHGSNTPVLAMGDFNDEPFDRALVEYALSERQRMKVTLATSPRFLTLMWPLAGNGIGTLYYNNVANLLDQFLASRPVLTGNGGFRVVDRSAGIDRYPEMVGTGRYPVPIRYGRDATLNPNGFSDHLPITVELEEA